MTNNQKFKYGDGIELFGNIPLTKKLNLNGLLGLNLLHYKSYIKDCSSGGTCIENYEKEKKGWFSSGLFLTYTFFENNNLKLKFGPGINHLYFLFVPDPTGSGFINFTSVSRLEINTISNLEINISNQFGLDFNIIPGYVFPSNKHKDLDPEIGNEFEMIKFEMRLFYMFKKSGEKNNNGT